MKKIIAAILAAGFCGSVLTACVVETPRRGYYHHARGYDHGYHRGY
jgi:hypothetical protein